MTERLTVYTSKETIDVYNGTEIMRGPESNANKEQKSDEDEMKA